MRLSVITINYNESESTIKLLKSLSGQSDKEFEIIVVDNASEEADFNNLKTVINRQDLFKQVLPVNLIRNSQNLGFSGGINVGIEKAQDPPTSGGLDPAYSRASWALLLNNDTSVESGFIDTLKAKLGGLEGIVGIPLIEGDRTAYYGHIAWLRPTLKHAYNPPYAEYLRRNRNLYAIGGAMAIHGDVFNRIGLFDEKYFLYFEDADFTLRASRVNIPISFIDEPKVNHPEVSKTTKKIGSPLLLRYHYRNALYFNWKNGTGYIKFLVWLWSFWIIKKQLLKIMFFYKQADSSAILSGVFDFYKGKMGKI